jgi:threonine dehydrogenase-like Zn-dependent dehydrogenase
LWFEGNERVSLREEPLDPPGSGEVLLESIVSAISAGTEMHFYRGDLEEGVMLDTVLEGYRHSLSYPLRYGHASVGKIACTGKGVAPALAGRLAFAYMPHASAGCIPAEQALLLPQDMDPECAALLATAETAVNLVLDCRPLLGERVSVFGLGVVGLMTVGLLARFPLARLSGWDLYPVRREAAAALGAVVADPSVTQPAAGTEDLAVELSGSTAGFRLAVSACGFSGRVVVGSWYGTRSRPDALDAFDSVFHRNRVRIIPSQVSTIDPALSGRWTRARRHEAAWEALRVIRPSRLITHRVPFSRAGDAYRLIADAPAQTMQVMLVHESAEKW